MLSTSRNFQSLQGHSPSFSNPPEPTPIDISAFNPSKGIHPVLAPFALGAIAAHCAFQSLQGHSPSFSQMLKGMKKAEENFQSLQGHSPGFSGGIPEAKLGKGLGC